MGEYGVTSLRIQNLSCRYHSSNYQVLQGINLCISSGERVSLLGSSGAGKSTLMKCINQLIRPIEGSIILDGEEIWSMKSRATAENQRKIGMIFQEFALVERITALDNVLVGCLGRVPMLSSVFGTYPENEKDFAISCLERVGLGNKILTKVQDLSGGQRQRVAIARVLAQKPKVILADEPVSNLDPPLRHHIMMLLTDICHREHLTLLVSLHFPDLIAEYSTRTIGLQKGKIVFDGNSQSLDKKDFSQIYEDITHQ